MAAAAALLTQCVAGVEVADGAQNPIRYLLGDVSASNTVPLPPGVSEASTLSKEASTTSSSETADAIAGMAVPVLDPEWASPRTTAFVGFLTDVDMAWSQGFEPPATGLMLCLEEDKGWGPGKVWSAYCLALELGAALGTEATLVI